MVGRSRNLVREAIDDLWWLFVLEGLIVVLFGLVALFFPGLTLVMLVYTFAIFTIAWGVVEVVHGLSDIGRTGWWMTLLFGLLSIGLGVFLVRNPDVLASMFVILAGAFLLGRGVFDLYMAGFVYEQTETRVLWVLAGILAIIAAIAIWSYPVATSLAFVWVLGLYAVIGGSITIAHAFRLRPENN